MAQNVQTVHLGSDASFKDIVGAFGRQKSVIIVTLLLALLIGLVVSLVVPQLWESVTSVLVEGRTAMSPTGTGPDEGLSGIGSSTNYDVGTQMALMQSQDVVIAAYLQAGIELPNPMTIKAIERLPRVVVDQKGSNNIVQVVVTAERPADAYNVAKAIPQVYEDQIRVKQRDTLNRANAFFDSRVDEEEKGLKAASDKLTEFKKSHNLMELGDEAVKNINGLTTLTQQYSEASAALEAARANYAAQEQARAGIAATKNRPMTQTNNDQLQREEDVLHRLEVQRADLVTKYLPENPQVMAIDAQIKDQKSIIAGLKKTVVIDRVESNPEIETYDRILNEAKGQLQAATAREAKFRALVEEKKADISAKIGITGEQQQLMRQIDDRRLILSHLKEQRDAIRLRTNQIKTPISVVSPARTADMIRPNWIVNMGAATILGLLFGAVFAVARDNVSEKVTSIEGVEAVTGRPVLAQIPLRRKSSNPVLDEQQKAAAFESYRVLRTNLQYTTKNVSPIKFLVTSVSPGEGVSVVAANLARAYALSGKRVIYIDANFRRPSGGTLFGLESGKQGLGELLSGTESARGFLQATSADGLSVLTAGAIPGSIAEALSSSRMKTVLDELTAMSDVIIVDSASVAGLADTLSLAPLVERVLLVTVPGVADRTEMHRAVDNFSVAGANVVGVVVNKYDAKKLYQPQFTSPTA